jgi:putative tryptophan/tyrosine transport system substrate-binding protein
MRRRDFITLLGGAAGAWTCADTFAAQRSSMARIAILGVSPPPLEAGVDILKETLKTSLYALGWRLGENLQIEERFGNGDTANLPRLATELVALQPDVLIAVATTEAKVLLRTIFRSCS